MSKWLIVFSGIGLRFGTRSWKDYERGKQIISASLPDEYEKGIRELTEYLCL